MLLSLLSCALFFARCFLLPSHRHCPAVFHSVGASAVTLLLIQSHFRSWDGGGHFWKFSRALHTDSVLVETISQASSVHRNLRILELQNVNCN